jgi:hypothetical protein
LVNTAWMVRVLVIDARPIRFQVSPKSARLMRTCASSHASPSPRTAAVPSKVTGRARSRTLRMPVTVTPGPDGRIPSTVKVMSGWGPVSKKSAERRWVSRLVFLVSIDRRRGHRDDAAHLARRGDGAVAGDLAEDAVHRKHARWLGDAGSRRPGRDTG